MRRFWGWSDLGLEENERFFERELGCGVEGKAEEGEGRLAGLARLASGGAGHQTSSCAGGGCDAKQCAPVAAEREKVAEAEAEAEEEEEMDVEALLQRHEELVESMLAEVKGFGYLLVKRLFPVLGWFDTF